MSIMLGMAFLSETYELAKFIFSQRMLHIGCDATLHPLYHILLYSLCFAFFGFMMSVF